MDDLVSECSRELDFCCISTKGSKDIQMTGGKSLKEKSCTDREGAHLRLRLLLPLYPTKGRRTRRLGESGERPGQVTDI